MSDPGKLMMAERRLAYILRHVRMPFTSWNQFDEIREDHPVLHNLTYNQIMDAVRLGLNEWMLRGVWAGIGMTPWAGSARRSRMYEIKSPVMVKIFLTRVEAIEKYEAEEMKKILGHDYCPSCHPEASQ